MVSRIVGGVINYRMYLIFLFASLGISIGIQMLIPGLTGLAIALGIFMIFPLLLRMKYMKRMGGYGSEPRGGGFFGMGQQGSNPVKYVCLVCNHKYKGGSCPRCGSKMKRADF